MKNKIIFLVCAVFLTIACEKEQHTGKESRVSVTVYDENGKAMPGIPVKMYDEKDYKAFEQDNLTPPTAGATANAQGIALFTLPGEVWFSGQSQRFLTFVVQEGGGPDNYRIWSVGKTIDAGKNIQLEIRLTSALTPGEEQPEDKGTLIGLSIAQPPHKIAYTLGEPLNLDGLLLTGVYSNGKEYPVTITPEQVSGFSSDAPADRLVLTIGIEDRQATFTVSIAPIRVQEGVLTEIYKGYSEITLPPHVTAIAPEAFMQNRQITRVVMNEGLTSIGEMAFFNSGIQEIVFPSTLQQLAPDLFYYCDRLKRVDLSHTQITRIPESAFACSGVEEVLLPVCTHSHRNTSIHDDGTSEIRSNPPKRHTYRYGSIPGKRHHHRTTSQQHLHHRSTCLLPMPQPDGSIRIRSCLRQPSGCRNQRALPCRLPQPCPL